MNLSRVIRISRPRFWIYELGPYMIGILAALLAGYGTKADIDIVIIGLMAFYFLIPANIWIYGINDIYDYETDKLNPKKVEGYEALVLPHEQEYLWKRILRTTTPFVILVLLYHSGLRLVGILLTLYIAYGPFYISHGPTYGGKAKPLNETLFGEYISSKYKNIEKPLSLIFLAVLLIVLIQYGTGYFIPSLLGFLFFSGQYSAHPIRAKAKPIIDMIFSAGHYVMTAVFAWTLIAPIGEINRRYMIAGMCWCMAMHLYSAIPDIQADTEAGLSTTAMLTGERGGLVLCMILYALAAALSFGGIGIISLILGVVYLVMMIWTWVKLRDISQIYRYFPWVNMISGMCIFLVLLYTLIYG